MTDYTKTPVMIVTWGDVPQKLFAGTTTEGKPVTEACTLEECAKEIQRLRNLLLFSTRTVLIYETALYKIADTDGVPSFFAVTAIEKSKKYKEMDDTNELYGYVKTLIVEREQYGHSNNY